MSKTWDEIGEGLRAKFPPEDLEWRVQQSGQKDTQNVWAMLVPFISNRGVQTRFDDVVGPGNWKNEFKEIRDGDNLIGFLCGLSVRLDPDHEWTTKWDGAPCTKIEALKGGISDAMKRAAVEWGCGRYLYGMPTVWAITTPQKQAGSEWKYQKASGRVMAYYWTPKWTKELKESFLPEGAKVKGSKTEATQPDPMTDPEIEETPTVDGLPADIHADLDQQETVEDLKQKCAEYKPAGQQEGWIKAMYKFYDKKARELEENEMDKGGLS